MAVALQVLAIYVVLDVAAKGAAALLPGVEPFSLRESLSNTTVVPVAIPLAVMVHVLALVLHPSGARIASARTATRVLGRRVREGWAFTLSTLGRGARSRWLLLGVLAGCVAWAAVTALLPVLPAPPAADLRTDALAAAGPFTRSVWAAIISPLPEEVLYRGPLLLLATATHRWSRQGLRLAILAVATVASTAVFGLSHLGWSVANMVATVILGGICAAITLRSRSLWPAVITHAVYNAL
jgi:membrane protease YdiL (CAAX protease family)